MADRDLCETLIAELCEIKKARNDALKDNAEAENAGKPFRPYSEQDLAVLQRRTDEIARRAREAGCDIDDVVGPNVARLD